MKHELIVQADAPDAPVSRPRYEKSERAFRTIGEVALELDVAQHVLRFWESRFSQIRPIQRNGGRRYYRPEDVALLRRIRSALYDDGFTIKGVQRLLSGSRGLSAVSRLESAAVELAPDDLAAPTKKLDGAKRREVEGVLSDLENALDLLRTTLSQP